MNKEEKCTQCQAPMYNSKGRYVFADYHAATWSTYCWRNDLEDKLDFEAGYARYRCLNIERCITGHDIQEHCDHCSVIIRVL